MFVLASIPWNPDPVQLVVGVVALILLTSIVSYMMGYLKCNDEYQAIELGKTAQTDRRGADDPPREFSGRSP